LDKSKENLKFRVDEHNPSKSSHQTIDVVKD